MEKLVEKTFDMYNRAMSIEEVPAIEPVSPKELKVKAKIIKEIQKKTRKSAPAAALYARARTLGSGTLSHSVRVLHSAGLCGSCRLPKKYCKCGRPPAMDEAMLTCFEATFKMGMSIRESCIHNGVSLQTYYDFERSHQEWRALRIEWQGTPSRTAREKVVSEIPKDTATARWWLEKKNRKEFGRDTEQQGGQGNIKINLIGAYKIDADQNVTPISVETVIQESQPLLDSSEKSPEIDEEQDKKVVLEVPAEGLEGERPETVGSI